MPPGALNGILEQKEGIRAKWRKSEKVCTLVNSNINIGLLATTDVQYYCHMLIIGEPGCRVYANSLLSLKFLCTSKTALKYKGYQNKIYFQHGLLSVPQIFHPNAKWGRGYGKPRGAQSWQSPGKRLLVGSDNTS